MDERGEDRSQGRKDAAEGGGEPLGEGTNVRAKEGVDSVGKSMVGAEPAVGQRGQNQARTHGVHQVRTRARHGRAVIKLRTQLQYPISRSDSERERETEPPTTTNRNCGCHRSQNTH